MAQFVPNDSSVPGPASEPPDPSSSQSAPYYSCAASDTGHVRKINEDAYLDAREQGLWVVADGMGGHSRGDVASQSIISALHTFEAGLNGEDNVADLVARLKEANRNCREIANGTMMGSTVAALHVHDNTAFILWAGDSRVYRLRGKTLEQLSEDHSLVQELHRLGELSADEAENHPSGNVITRAIGVSDNIDIQRCDVAVQPGDRFLLCSDGLFKDVTRDDVEKNLALPSPRHALERLVKQALRRGGSDNVTAIVVQMPLA